MALGHESLSVLPLSTLPSAGAAGAYTLTATGGTYVITGTAASLEWGHKLVAASASYAITGGAASLEVGREIAAGSGTYTITGGAAGLRAARKIVAGSGAFTISGTAASLEAGRKITAGSGTYAITGTDASLKATRKIAAASGSYVITGTAAGLEFGHELAAGSASYLITGSDATLTYTPIESVGGGGDPGYGYRPGEYDDSDVAIAERHREIMRLRDEQESQQDAQQQRIDLFIDEQEAQSRAREIVAKAIDRLPAVEAAERAGDKAAVAEQRQALTGLLREYQAAQALVLAEASISMAAQQRAQRIEFERLVRIELQRLALEESEFIELFLLMDAC